MKKSKGYAGGGKMKPKMSAKGMSKGGKLPMVEKDGKQVPFFAADGKGKMAGGGMVPKSKGYFKGGKTMATKGASAGGKMKPKGMAGGGRIKPKMSSKGKAGGGVARGSGAARPQAFRRNG
tara:strand:+ start:95 stop:457 length:363 start_codon:yes stop_codon:yes gene_type:complete